MQRKEIQMAENCGATRTEEKNVVKSLATYLSKTIDTFIDEHLINDRWTETAMTILRWWYSPSKDRVYERQGSIKIPWSISLIGRKCTRASRCLYKRSSIEENSKPDDCLPKSIL